MLDGLFVTPAVIAVTEALASARGAARGTAGDDGPIAVFRDAKLATALAANRAVVAIGLSPRAAKKLANALPDASSIAPGSLAAMIVPGITTDEAWPNTLRAWSRLVRDGGAIVFVDKGQAAEASRRALCGGLSEVEQRHAGRSVITSGLVSHL